MRQFNRAFFRDLWQIVRPYWGSSDERWSARLLLAAIVVLDLVTVAVSYLITKWYRTFWNALQRYQAKAAFHELWIFVVLVTPYIIAAVYQTYLTQMLQIRWRRWLTEEYLDTWLDSGTYYQMQITGDDTDNPDQRIAEDLDSFTSQTLNLSVGLLNAFATLAAFLTMLWVLSSRVIIPFHGRHLVIPGYLVWAAVVYAFFGTILTAWVGRPLIQLDFEQERFQADFRFGLVRLRENSESVALYGGEPRERRHLLGRFGSVFSNFWRIMVRTKRLNWWVSGYGQAALIFPILVSLPAYFARAIKIGAIMQISSAFGQVQNALSFIVDSYTSLASWHAVVDRLRFFQQAMERTRIVRRKRSKIVLSDGPLLRVSGLDVELPDGRQLVDKLNLETSQGARVLITGPSGSGKSTLIRALSGIWPYGAGQVELPARPATLVLPQRPYLPLGSLRDVLLYPYGDASISDEELRRVLERIGLPKLAPQLHIDQAWAHVLSLGEQQRLAFGRIFLQAPSWVFMDEATSALDEPAEATLYAALIHDARLTGVVSVGHRSSLLAFHTRRVGLRGDGSWSLEDISRVSSVPPSNPQVAE